MGTLSLVKVGSLKLEGAGAPWARSRACRATGHGALGRTGRRTARGRGERLTPTASPDPRLPGSKD